MVAAGLHGGKLLLLLLHDAFSVKGALVPLVHAGITTAGSTAGTIPGSTGCGSCASKSVGEVPPAAACMPAADARMRAMWKKFKAREEGRAGAGLSSRGGQVDALSLGSGLSLLLVLEVWPVLSVVKTRSSPWPRV